MDQHHLTFAQEDNRQSLNKYTFIFLSMNCISCKGINQAQQPSEDGFVIFLHMFFYQTLIFSPSFQLIL